MDPPTKRKTRDQFAGVAERYRTSVDHSDADDREILLSRLALDPSLLLLDVATGGGHTAVAFSTRVRKVVASDLTPEMLWEARALAAERHCTNMAFVAADAESLPFAPESFDRVTCRIAPHHFPDCARFVREGARVLKPGRALLVQDHVLPEDPEAARAIDAFERLRDPSHQRAFAASEWADMFRRAGLAVAHTEQVVKQHAFLPWAERQGCTPDVIARLVEMMRGAAPAVVQWLQPRAFGTPQATFVNRHILILGRKE